MIDRLVGWTWEPDPEGVTLESPGVGRIRYTPRVRPLRPLSELLDQARGDRAFRITRPPEELVTWHGDRAALLSLEGLSNRAPAQRTVGLVFGDGFYSQTTGVSLRPSRFARVADTVRQLVLGERLTPGRRRSRFAPPIAWRAHGDRFHAPPPSRMMLTLYPTLPRTPKALAQSLEAASAGISPGTRVAVTQEPCAVAGLHGTDWRIRFASSIRRLIVLEDDLFLYPLQLDAPDAELGAARAVLDDVTRSLQPLRPRDHEPPLRRAA